MMSILAIIPARKDSERCSAKNTRHLDNISLYWYTLNVVFKLKENYNLIDRFCITTNDNTILKNTNKNVVDTIKRPNKLCRNNSTEFEFIEHTLNWYKNKGITFDDVAILYPTTPFKKIETLIKIFNQWKKNRQWVNQLRTVKEIRWEPEKIWYSDYLKSTNIHNYTKCFYQDHYRQVPYCYIYKVDKLNKDLHYRYQPCYKFIIDNSIESHDINTELDFWVAEKIVEDKLNE